MTNSIEFSLSEKQKKHHMGTSNYSDKYKSSAQINGENAGKTNFGCAQITYVMPRLMLTLTT